MSILNPNAKFTINSYPFNYMIIEDLFEEATASGLNYLFSDLIQNAVPIGKVGEVGDLVYDALNYSPFLTKIQSTNASIFASNELRELISGALQIQLDENFMLGMHRHNPPSRAGWTHTDFAVVSFPNVSPNYKGMRLYYDNCNCVYSDDSRDRQPDTIKTARAVACLYYIGNPEWKPGMGGETGVYTDMGKRLVSSVPPRNNSLFVFEISPISYHAYLGSESFQRNSFIWWYHANPNYLLHRHSVAAAFRTGQNVDVWDRWTKEDIPKFETHAAS